MRSSGGSGKSGGRGNHRGAGNNRDQKQGQGQAKGQGRPSKPRPEERRYDVGPGASHEGPKAGRGGAARGGAKGGPKKPQQRGRSAPATSREYETRAEERNRER